MDPQPTSSHLYVDSRPALAALLERLSRADRVAVDTEADSLHSYYEKVCLIQLSADGNNYVVDPLAGVDLSPLLHLLAGKTLIFHGADYDLRMLRASFGFRPDGEVHDTHIAAQLIGIEEVGLVSLAGRFCDVTLAKAGQKTDWSRRPLTAAQLAYAVDDTRHLETLADHLLAELADLGRLDWYREACERLIQSTASDRLRDPEDAWRIKGLRGLDHRQLAFVREIWNWREHEAQKADIPPFKVLGNAPLIHLALWAEAHPTDSLAHGPKLPRTCKGHRLHALERACRRAQDLPESGWPGPPRRRQFPRRSPEYERQVKALMAECSQIAARLHVAQSVLAPRAAVEAIVAAKPRSAAEILACSPVQRWQAELLAPAVSRILATEEEE